MLQYLELSLLKTGEPKFSFKNNGTEIITFYMEGLSTTDRRIVSRNITLEPQASDYYTLPRNVDKVRVTLGEEVKIVE